VLYGGGDVFNNGPALGDTWVWNGTTWSPKCGTTMPGATVLCAPGPQDLVSAATGPTGAVLYGGQTNDGAGNTTLHGDSTAWRQICSACAPGARARRGHFSNEQAALKVLYLVATQRRPNRENLTGTIKGWKHILNALATHYGDRIAIPNHR
jgi:hypothetical protein